MRADREERRIELPLAHAVEDVIDFRIEPDLDTEVDDALHFCLEHVARQAILRDTEAHHAAHHRARIHNGDVMAETAQVIGRRHAGRPCADDQDSFAGFPRNRIERPPPPDRLIAEKPFD